jgi:hypothetical protein
MEILSREQYEEGIIEDNCKKQKIVSIGDLIKRKLEKPENKRRQTENQALAEEINKEFSDLSIPAICGMCKKIGTRAVREIFIEVCKGNGRDKLALFLYQVGKDYRGIKWL